MFRYAISGIAGLSANAQATGDTWVTIAPGGARAAAPAAGGSLNWVSDSADATFTIENAILNGRRLYSFRGGGGSVLDVYDIPSNTWALGPLTYQRAQITFNVGTSFVCHKGIIYINDQQNATGNFYRFNCATQTIDALARCQYPPAGQAVAGQKIFVAAYYDGATEIDWVYAGFALSLPWFRLMLI